MNLMIDIKHYNYFMMYECITSYVINQQCNFLVELRGVFDNINLYHIKFIHFIT